MAAKMDMATLRATPWDLGPLTRRQVSGKVIEQVTTLDPKTGKAVNPNGVIRTRRETWIGRYHRKGKLTDAQANIAMELVEASAGLPQRDPLSALRIDRTNSGEDPEVARVDRRRKYFQMWQAVPVFARPVIQHVVLGDQSLRSMPGCINGRVEACHQDRLQRGLDALSAAWSRSRA